MARPRIAENVLEMRGSFKKDPQRRRSAPRPKSGIGPCPPPQAMSVSEAWDFIVGLAPNGVLFDRDRAYLRIAAELYSHLSIVGIEKISSAKLGRLDVMLSKLGLNPSDASRVGSGDGADQQNEFAD